MRCSSGRPVQAGPCRGKWSRGARCFAGKWWKVILTKETNKGEIGSVAIPQGYWISILPVFLSLALTAHAQSGLPDGPGRTVVERMCTTCHGLNVFTGQRMTRQRCY
jgi:hypothetical protein